MRRSMRMQTQGSRRLSSEATTLLIFQPFASLHHQNQSAARRVENFFLLFVT